MDPLDKYKNYKTVLTVNAFIYSEGKLLLLKRADNKRVDPGLYSGIGGKVEPQESFYNALIREIEEETGITEIESIRPFSITQHPYPPTDSEWVNFYFVVTIPKQKHIDPTDDGTFHWINPKEINNYPTPEDIKEYVGILNQNPQAFILGFFDHDTAGDLTEKTLKVFS